MDPKPQPEPVPYVCAECGEENPLKPEDLKRVIQCRECGHHILYKKRIQRTYPIQFEAR